MHSDSFVPSNINVISERLSEIRVRGEINPKKVKITSRLKPEVIEPIVIKWQSLLNTAAVICNVPSGLITKLNEDNLEVFLNSQTPENPFYKGDKFDLGFGHYCEKVIGIQKELVVNNALQEPLWEEDARTIIEMKSYMGVPLNWPDGEVFGTLCMLDRKENPFGDIYLNLVKQVKQHIESDLNLLILNHELLLQNQRIEHLNSLKSKFLSIIAHDIRGGVSSIEQLLNIMLSSYDNYSHERTKPILESINQTAGSVLLTLENLLNWSKLNLLELETKKTEVDLVKIFNDLLIYFQLSISIKELEIKKAFYSNSIVVFADENMLYSSLRNILSNAIKFNKAKGSVFLRINKKSNSIVIEIEDTGIGMNENTLSNLFQFNPNALKQGAQGEPSAGVGLFLVKDFLNKNDAQVSVDSTPGKGTIFTITI